MNPNWPWRPPNLEEIIMSQMPISESTINLLKNFHGINNGIVLNPGNIITTFAPGKSVYAKATIQESLPIKCGIYDVGEFISAMSLMAIPILDFEDKFCNIIDSENTKQKIKYYYGNTETIFHTEKELILENPSITFDLPKESLSSIMKAANVLKVSSLIIESDGKEITLTVCDKKTPNQFSIGAGKGNGKLFKAYVSIENLKLIEGSYEVAIVFPNMIQFTLQGDQMLKYVIALEADSIIE